MIVCEDTSLGQEDKNELLIEIFAVECYRVDCLSNMISGRNDTEFSKDSLECPDWYVAMLLVSCILITIPNSILLVFLFKMKSLRKQVSNQFIKSFTISDLMTGAVVFPLGIIHEIEYAQRFSSENSDQKMSTSQLSPYSNKLGEQMNNLDDLGEGFCDLLQVTITFFSYLSVYHMALISLDRFYRITRPIRYKRFMNKSRTTYTCLVLWTFCAGLTYFFHWHYKQSGVAYEPSQCVVYITTDYIVYAFAMAVGMLPMVIMAYYYIKLILLSRYAFKSNIPLEVGLPIRRCEGGHQCMAMTAMPISCMTRRRTSSSSDSEEYQEISDPRNSRTESEILEIRARKKRVRRSKRAAILVGFIIGGHFVFTMPPCIVYILYTFWREVGVQNTSFFYLYPWMTFFNSAYNPCIYFLLTKELRTTFWSWIRKQAPLATL